MTSEIVVDAETCTPCRNDEFQSVSKALSDEMEMESDGCRRGRMQC
jgi:hypothetical protein